KRGGTRWGGATAAPSDASLQDQDTRHEEIEADADQHEIDQEREGPTHVVTDHRAFVAHEAAGRDADARSLRRHWLARFGADRVEVRQQHRWEAQQLPYLRLELAEHRVRRGVASREGHANPTEDRRNNDEPGADFGESVGERTGHAGKVKYVGQAEDEDADQK